MSGLLRGILLTALLAIGMGLLAGCGEEGTPSGGFPGSNLFTVTANLITNAGPIATGTQVSLNGVNGTPSIPATVGANGAVTFTNVPAGTYIITTPAGNSGPIVVGPNAVNLGTIAIGPGFVTATGTLTSTNGGPVNGLQLQLINGANGQTFTTTTGAGGGFSFTVPPGTYTLQLTGQPGTGQQVVVGPGGVTGVTFSVPTAVLFTVSGNLVTGPNGNVPVNGVTVTINPPAGVVTVNGNNFTVTNLPAGTYTLTFTGGGIVGQNTVVFTVPGPNGNVNLGNVPVTTTTGTGTGTGLGGFGG